MKCSSADEIRDEWQHLAVGDVVPTDPLGGFVVQALEPERALVLFVDAEIGAATWGSAPAEPLAGDAPGLAASGRFLEAAVPPEFAVSWAFALEPLAGGRTRLIERVRLGIGSQGRANALLAPLMGLGVFVMMERQMRGIRSRAERAHVLAAHPSSTLAVAVHPVPAPPAPIERERSTAQA